ncbi:sterile alpha motif domain-containing protein 15 [Pelodytes ibericus]
MWACPCRFLIKDERGTQIKGFLFPSGWSAIGCYGHQAELVVTIETRGLMMDPQLPDCVRWNTREVGGWIRHRGFPQYEACFTENCINGRKLIHVTCSTLPQIGVTDFQHMKAISNLIRDLLGITEPLWTHSISLPRRDNVGLFLEQKSMTGVTYDSLTYKQFVSQQGLQ